MDARTVLLTGIIIALCAGGYADSITVDFANPIGNVNTRVLGDSQVGYDPKGIFGGESIDDYSNYGAGLWNPQERRSVPRVIELARDRGLSVSRFPGGCGTHTYNWKRTIGPVKDRPQWQFGIDEFLTTCNEMDAVPLISLSYFVGGPQDCADLVEYLNATDDDNHPWAAKRAANGHVEPYGVMYFEYGNECFHTADHKGLVDPHEYVARFIATAEAMKSVDPKAKLGAIAFNDFPLSAWNEIVFEGTRDHADFIVEHTYKASLDYVGKKCPVAARQIFESALAAPEEIRRKYVTLTQLIREKTGREDLKLAITEYNSTFLGEDPAPYRLCLGNALYMAELIRMHMRPECNILMANQWQFINEYFGMVKGPKKGEPGEYTRRPNYWPFWLYHHHFGPILLPASVECDTYSTKASCGVLPAEGAGRSEAEFLSDNLLAGKAWTHTPLEGAEVKEEDGVLTLTFDPSLKEKYTHSKMHIKQGVRPGATYRISAEVKFSRDIWGVRVHVGDARGSMANSPGVDTFWPLPHKDVWTKQYADYTTLPGAEGLEVYIYWVAKEGTVVVKPDLEEPEIDRVRNVQVREVLPEILPAVPYLGVNASKSADGKTVYLMVVNKNQDEAVTVPITTEGFEPKRLRAWVLNGPSIDATNEDHPDNVKVTEKPERQVENGFEFTFEPHSLTAIELRAA